MIMFTYRHSKILGQNRNKLKDAFEKRNQKLKQQHF